jgi:hypothetical protein
MGAIKLSKNGTGIKLPKKLKQKLVNGLKPSPIPIGIAPFVSIKGSIAIKKVEKYEKK